MRYIYIILFLILHTNFIWAQKTSDYIAAANKGDVEAQCNLGVCYYEGDGVAKNYTKAAYWFEKAADKGSMEAQCNLGTCYYTGRGVSQNYVKAVYWYQKAADNGYAIAQYKLGLCYYDGQGVSQNYVKAVYWYQKAADNGYAIAQFNLGTCYYTGRGVSRNYVKAVYWYQKAADNGFKEAQFCLGLCYYDGQGVSQNYCQAAYWYQKAAEKGLPIAQFKLGYCYLEGKGVEKNDSHALYYFNKVCEIEEIENYLSENQRLALTAIILKFEKDGVIARRPPSIGYNSQSQSSNTSITNDSTQPIVESPTEFPQFHGGYDAMMNYFANNLTYPEAAEIEGIQGRVIVRFVVNTDGSIGDVRVLRSVHKTVDSEAIRLVRSMPKWIPGKLNGKPVRTEFTVPITFRLK